MMSVCRHDDVHDVHDSFQELHKSQCPLICFSRQRLGLELQSRVFCLFQEAEAALIECLAHFSVLMLWPDFGATEILAFNFHRDLFRVCDGKKPKAVLEDSRLKPGNKKFRICRIA